MVLPPVDDYLALCSGREVAVWYSTLQFGGSMVFPHVRRQLVVMDTCVVAVWY